MSRSRGPPSMPTYAGRPASALAPVPARPRAAPGLRYVARPAPSVAAHILRAAMPVVRTTDPAAADQPAVATVEAAVAAYRGDLLETVYSDWCLLWREN